jgi:hypothetical protein
MSKSITVDENMPHGCHMEYVYVVQNKDIVWPGSVYYCHDVAYR